MRNHTRPQLERRIPVVTAKDHNMLRPNQTLISFLLQKTVSPKGGLAKKDFKQSQQLCEYCAEKLRMTRQEATNSKQVFSESSPLLEYHSSSEARNSGRERLPLAMQQLDSTERYEPDIPAASSPLRQNSSRSDARTYKTTSGQEKLTRCVCRSSLENTGSFQKFGISSFDKTASGNKGTNTTSIIEGASACKVSAKGSSSFNRVHIASKSKYIGCDDSQPRDMFLADFIDIRLEVPEEEGAKFSQAECQDENTNITLQRREDEFKLTLSKASRQKVRVISESSSDPQQPRGEQWLGSKATFPKAATSSGLDESNSPESGLAAHSPDQGANPRSSKQAKSEKQCSTVDGQNWQVWMEERPTGTGCRVCSSSCQNFSRSSGCCGTRLCLRCVDKFLAPHLRHFGRCPFCRWPVAKQPQHATSD